MHCMYRKREGHVGLERQVWPNFKIFAMAAQTGI